jgi:hypothetical protein
LRNRFVMERISTTGWCAVIVGHACPKNYRHHRGTEDTEKRLPWPQPSISKS